MSLHSTEVGDPAGAEQGRVVFLHGLFGQGRNFTPIARALQPQLRSLLVDLPNHGRSDWTESVAFADAADLVAEHLRADFAADGPVHVVGHSMGGKVAMLLALRHPELVDRLVVIDIAPAASDGAGEFAHLLASLATLDLDALDRRGDADVALRSAIADDRVRGFLLQNLRADSSGRWRWQANLALLRRHLDVVEGFPEVEGRFDRPVLWMAGELSDYVLPAHAAAMRRLFPRTTQVTIKDAGHWVHSEQPDAVVSALRVFLGAGMAQR